MATHRLDGDPRCPICSAQLRGATGTGTGDRSPKPGDLMVCLYCGAALRYAAGQALERLPDGDFAALHASVRARIERVRDITHRLQRPPGSKYEWTAAMTAEISGFGGAYEASCRAMLLAALEWLDGRFVADPIVYEPERGGIFVAALATDVPNLMNADARALLTIVNKAIEPLGRGGCSLAMFGAIVQSARFVRRHGWPAFVEHMSKGRGRAALN